VRPVAVLFARADSIYKTMPGCDVWDEARDARRWPTGMPLVAHPPCAQWGKLRQFATVDPAVKALGPLAVEFVREWGGVLEHPAESLLWAHCGMPTPGRAPDWFGGWTAEIRQCDWGHKAEKKTWLYIVGVHPDDIPALPDSAEPTHYIKRNRKGYRPCSQSLPHVTKAEREHTPPRLAEWLIDLARRTRVSAEVAA
jgi:hypothetical protein